MPTLNSKYSKHLKAVDGSMDGFAEIMESIMNDVLNKIDGYARQFLEAGNLSTSQVLEAVQNNQIREDILTMLRESGFGDAADLYVNNWDELSIDGLSDVFKTADIPLSFTSSNLDLMSQLQDFNVSKALSVESVLAENLQATISNMALGGASWEDTFPELKKRVDIDVHKNLKAQLNTGLSTFDQAISNQVMEEAGVTKYEYYGPPPERSFCKHVVRVQSASDFKGWTKARIEGLASRSDWKQGAGGLSSPFTARGGWNCTHSWGVWIGDDVIDEDVAEEIAVIEKEVKKPVVTKKITPRLRKPKTRGIEEEKTTKKVKESLTARELRERSEIMDILSGGPATKLQEEIIPLPSKEKILEDMLEAILSYDETIKKVNTGLDIGQGEIGVIYQAYKKLDIPEGHSAADTIEEITQKARVKLRKLSRDIKSGKTKEMPLTGITIYS